MSNVPSLDPNSYDEEIISAAGEAIRTIQKCRRVNPGGFPVETIVWNYTYQMTLKKNTNVSLAVLEGEKLVGTKLATSMCDVDGENRFYLHTLDSVPTDTVQAECATTETDYRCHVVQGYATSTVFVDPTSNVTLEEIKHRFGFLFNASRADIIAELKQLDTLSSLFATLGDGNGGGVLIQDEGTQDTVAATSAIVGGAAGLMLLSGLVFLAVRRRAMRRQLGMHRLEDDGQDSRADAEAGDAPQTKEANKEENDDDDESRMSKDQMATMSIAGDSFYTKGGRGIDTITEEEDHEEQMSVSDNMSWLGVEVMAGDGEFSLASYSERSTATSVTDGERSVSKSPHRGGRVREIITRKASMGSLLRGWQ